MTASSHKFLRECLTIRIDRRSRSTDVIDVLSDQSILLTFSNTGPA
ncbi:hypothetical protein [Jannaschia aquimarina]|uniref:Uncharacterized protein n=1 Tax=Jannaschia aquimarina TaxID=935700 RepID=A0A0D1CJZ7_9RHOB|nr:hypothetical protein [Jannaschia aquimarina]KIT15072.1 hypothetical protein jaqu_33980 [Jannaschia aquimarina]SNS63325.1 hypothetical protein SAMN05421775_101724 [Jannaschia aquimarina]